MKIYVYAGSKTDVKRRFVNEILSVPGLAPTLFPDHRSFIDAVKTPGMERKVIVFLAADQDDLSFILSQGEIISDSRLILILPDRAGETLGKGFALYPRYQSFADGDFKDVAAVLKKMSEFQTS